MKNLPFVLPFVLLTALCVSCVTTKTLQNEKAMEDWLSQANMPVTVQYQSADIRCRPTLNCYTLIDATGKVHYARNVRHELPRIIPEDSTRLRRGWLERLVGER